MTTTETRESRARAAASQPPPRADRARRTSALSEAADNAGVLGDLVLLIWERKLWWMVPLLLALLFLGALLFLQATPVGPLLYPIF